MTKRYAKDFGYWYDLDTGEIEGRAGEYHQSRPVEQKTGLYVIKDIEPYESPLGTGLIGSRRERREELKRHGLREVDPSEFKTTFQNERFMQKHGIVNRE